MTVPSNCTASPTLTTNGSTSRASKDPSSTDTLLAIGIGDYRDRAFVLTPIDDAQPTRFLFRSRWTTAPWWFTLGGWLLTVPADFVMSRDMLRGVRQRAESLASAGARR